MATRQKKGDSGCRRTEADAESALAQVNDASESGSKVKAFYRITELPVTLVIDPVTGASPKTWTGALDPQRCSNILTFCPSFFDSVRVVRAT